ncbi:uncharacterized protein [Littorina saxatilis]|uniref:Secreted protein n=1 Tax=Littorina saxatilis TaxID=31220 RepID=A0AAN9C2R1_9CAEN
MELVTPLFLAIVLCFACLVVAQENSETPTQCQQDEAADRKACFVDRSLDLAEMPKNLDTLHPLYNILESTFTMMDPSVHCSNPTAYRDAARCAVNVTKTCYDPDGTRNVIMSPDTVVAGMQVLCDKRSELDMECLKAFYMMADECTQYHRRAANFISSTDTRAIMCATEDLKYDCVEVLMKPMCGDNTTHVFLQQMDMYTVNPSCVNDSRPSRQRSRYFAALVHDDNDNGDDDNGKGEATHTTPTIIATVFVLAAVCVLNLF